MLQGRTQKFVEGGHEIVFLQILRDSHGEDLFLEIDVLRATSRDLFVTVTSTMAENGILHFSEGGARIGAPYVNYCFAKYMQSFSDLRPKINNKFSCFRLITYDDFCPQGENEKV